MLFWAALLPTLFGPILKVNCCCDVRQNFDCKPELGLSFAGLLMNPMCAVVMQAAARQVTEKGIQGSSTCCIVLVDSLHGRLASANVGDSGFMILGSTDYNAEPHVKFRTPQQEHQFGCPYQLGHHKAADPPEDAMLTALPVSALTCCLTRSISVQ